MRGTHLPIPISASSSSINRKQSTIACCQRRCRGVRGSREKKTRLGHHGSPLRSTSALPLPPYPRARTPEAGDGGLSGCPESWVVVSSSSSSSLSSLASEVSAYAAHPWRLAYSRRACDATRHDSTRRRVASGEREMDDGEAVAGRWCNGSGDGDLWFGGGRSAASGRSAAGRRQGGGGGGGGLWFVV